MYISNINRSLCFGTTLSMKKKKDSELLKRRDVLLIFLKGKRRKDWLVVLS